MTASPEPTLNIGQRLKAVRVSQQMSQRELARKSGVTNGMISQIEGNSTSPSVSSLKRILDAIPMSMSEFFSGESAGAKQVFFRASELRELNPNAFIARNSGDVSNLSLRQVGNGRDSAIQMLYERYPPGSSTGAALYSHNGEEAGIVVAGSIEVTVGDQTALLGPGDAYLFASRTPHRFHNTGDAECVVISACTPPSF
ncbi:cupin domain-containing protein [Hoeflea sp. YIM 152468]|uniref:cupin domain-containing protein n=1 Tax=Hoeflea sp. YIM 152468 TaxID=3031759 RepID=UPI0023DA83EA|nr:cupin domain-containing protein [Hoeflea sp. YIM 152468]MDF1608169.1 cupin domain-containing protein [Hoeflea sp. YIM 152468]